MKWANSTKTGKICTARIVTTTIDGRIHVQYQRTHVDHTPSVRFLHLTKDDREDLANQIRQGKTFNRILDDIRDSVSVEEHITRKHLVDKRDLFNIKRDYNLDKDVAHKNDAFSVEMWVKEQESLQDDSPVLYYKKQGCDDGSSLSTDDFMIVLMTPYQKDVISKYASEKISVDTTHKPTDYDFLLTSLVTVDEFGAGCPVAFCLSNRIDGVAMAEFFKPVEKKIGKILVKVFMSDDAPAYVNAWTDVMSKPIHQLICSWHIDKNWRENLKKVKDPDKQPAVYKACRMLMECMDIEEFKESLECFLLMCSQDPDTADFGKYFQKHYANRPEKWAFCYRKSLGLNTNMFLEAMHKKIKYCYMDGKQNRRVDKCISLLLRFARDMMFERTIRMVKNKPTYRMEQIAVSHRRSINMKDDLIENVDGDVWLVKSSTAGRGPYFVTLCLTNKCSGCPLACPDCQV